MKIIEILLNVVSKSNPSKNSLNKSQLDLVNFLKNYTNSFEKIYVGNGSSIQDYFIDKDINLTWLAFVEKIANAANANLDSLLTVDILKNNSQKDSFTKAINHKYKGDHLKHEYIDTSNLLITYAIVHRLANQYQDIPLHFTCLNLFLTSDLKNNFFLLEDFLRKFPECLPHNVKFEFIDFDFKNAKNHGIIQGTGPIDNQYEKTIKIWHDACCKSDQQILLAKFNNPLIPASAKTINAAAFVAEKIYKKPLNITENLQSDVASKNPSINNKTKEQHVIEEEKSSPAPLKQPNVDKKTTVLKKSQSSDIKQSTLTSVSPVVDNAKPINEHFLAPAPTLNPEKIKTIKPSNPQSITNENFSIAPPVLKPEKKDTIKTSTPQSITNEHFSIAPPALKPEKTETINTSNLQSVTKKNNIPLASKESIESFLAKTAYSVDEFQIQTTSSGNNHESEEDLKLLAQKEESNRIKKDIAVNKYFKEIMNADIAAADELKLEYEKAKPPQSHEGIINVFAIDLENILDNKNFQPLTEEMTKYKLIENNIELIDFIKKKQNDINLNICTIASVCQSYKQNFLIKDTYGINFFQNYCYLMKLLGEKFKLEPMLLEDLIDVSFTPLTLDLSTHFNGSELSFKRYPPFNTFTLANKLKIQSPKPCNIIDESKLLLSYAQIHKIAARYPKHKIKYHLIDSSSLKLCNLSFFYKTFTTLLPENVIFVPVCNDGDDLIIYKPDIVIGTGKIDYFFPERLQKFIELTYFAKKQLNSNDYVSILQKVPGLFQELNQQFSFEVININHASFFQKANSSCLEENDTKSMKI